ncbi:MAG: lipoyl(octanoyl) transferase LipB [Lentisphaerae bacterium]|nr:lipoyl(octanoyl) transferase LipB [Lentisphaerota bacterium]
MTYKFKTLDLGRCSYEFGIAEQDRIVEARRNGAVPDMLILLEHDPVYTLGRNADERHVIASPEKLAEVGIPLIRTGRGGDITYHGPGQVVAYPIMDLGDRGERVVWYVSSLEEILIRVLAEYGVEGRRDPANRGVWVGDEKIGAIGVRVARHITMHGFCLNVTVNLDNYRYIVPCGIHDKGVTSLDRLVNGVTVEDAKRLIIEKFGEVMGA